MPPTDPHATIQGESLQLREALDVVQTVAVTDCTVLITGESGTGKELFARAVHAASERSEAPFIALNCASIPDSMVEAELFGHARGSFTGAVGTRTGRIGAADGGTLFLDEVGDMPLAAQAKLLRVLQEGTVSPVGSDHDVQVDVRVVAATHRDLEQMVALGTFRADLYFRLCVVPIHIPALRDRGDDVLLLAHHFLAEMSARYKRPHKRLEASAERALLVYSWPGNVRELGHRIERAVLLSRGATITALDLKLGDAGPEALTQVTAPLQPVPLPTGETPSEADELNLKRALERVEKTLIEQALERTGGNRTEAAALLGLNRTTLVEKMRKRVG